MSDVEQLVKMANDIAAFFRSEPDHATAVAGVATHIRRYWEPRMRRRIHGHVAAGGSGLDALAREGVVQLAQDDPAARA